MDVGRAYASATSDKNDNLWITGGQVKPLTFSEAKPFVPVGRAFAVCNNCHLIVTFGGKTTITFPSGAP